LFLREDARKKRTFIRFFFKIKIWVTFHYPNFYFQLYYGPSPKRVVDFRSGWALCSCRFAFATENICCCRFAFAQLPGGAQPPLQSTYFHNRRFNKNYPQLLVMNLYYAKAN